MSRELNILERKARPAPYGGEVALISIPHNRHHPFVTGIVTEQTIANGEWYFGEYYTDEPSARRGFAGRK